MKKLIMSDLDGTYDLMSDEQKAEVDAIVTGNSWEDSIDVTQDINDYTVPIFFNPSAKDKVNLMSIVEHKSHVINRSGATEYWENQPDQVDLLKVMCPKAKINLFKP